MIEIHVGTAKPTHKYPDSSVTWFLPKRLITHYSPFLAAASNGSFKEHHENLIELPNDDPAIFTLFVEWLYYGDYAIAPFSLPSRSRTDIPSVDAECWVLGDKLLCADFKNHAMGRLYRQHTSNNFYTPISPRDVQFACENSSDNSALRNFYIDLATANFGKKDRVQGSVEEWDKVLLDQSDLRRQLLLTLRSGTFKQEAMNSEHHYLEDSPQSCVSHIDSTL